MVQQHTLSNGLRIIHQHIQSKVAYCGYAIDAGTRDEAEHQQGMAHFVEHMLFKGTQKRRAWHILNRMENVGGDLNAYTNKEETVVYTAFLAAHFSRAFELLTDIVFQSTFPQHEIDKEVEVIIDEIQSYEDTPSELIFDDFENLIFPNHPLGRNILGRPEMLKGFTTDDALAWTNNYYTPSNIVFFVLGDLNFKQIVRMAERLTAHLPLKEANHSRTLPAAYEPRLLKLNRDTHQAHVMIGGRGYDAHNEKRTALYLLNNLLGGPGMNSRLNLSLRERRGLVYQVESNLTSYTDTGTFCIYSQLFAAQKQLIGQIGVASDNNENNALGMAKTFLHYNKYDTPEKVFQRIRSLTSEILLEVSNEMFADNQLSTLIYC